MSDSEIDYDKIKADAILAADQAYASADVNPVQKAIEAAIEYAFLAMSEHVVDKHERGIEAALEERPEEDDAFIYTPNSWPTPKAICRRPKLASNEQWRPTAELIIKALAAYGMPTGTYGEGRTEKTQQGTMKKVQRYIEVLHAAGIRPKNEIEKGGTSLPHIYWMLETIEDRILNEDPVYDDGKISRWLGFGEYGIIINGLTNVETERNHSRPIFRK